MADERTLVEAPKLEEPLITYKPNVQQVGRAGEHYVAAEIHRRGAYATTFAGNMPQIDVVASNTAQTKTVGLQVKTRHSGDWQTSILRGRPRKKNTRETLYWVFVDLTWKQGRPRFFVAPAWWIENDIYTHHQEYLARHGGERAVTSNSKHHSIRLNRIIQWEDRWDLLRIFATQ